MNSKQVERSAAAAQKAIAKIAKSNQEAIDGLVKDMNDIAPIFAYYAQEIQKSFAKAATVTLRQRPFDTT